MLHIFHNYWITKSNIGVSALKKMFDTGQSKVKGKPEKSKSTTGISKSGLSCNYRWDGQPTHNKGSMLLLGKFILHTSNDFNGHN